MAHAGLSRRLSPFGNDLLKVVPFLPFSVMFLCETHEGTAKKSRDIGKSLFFALLTVHVGILSKYIHIYSFYLILCLVDRLEEFQHSVALTIHKLFLTSELPLYTLHLAFEVLLVSFLPLLLSSALLFCYLSLPPSLSPPSLSPLPSLSPSLSLSLSILTSPAGHGALIH